MKRERQGFHITYVHSLFQDLSRYSIIFDLLTLTLKNFNLSNNL